MQRDIRDPEAVYEALLHLRHIHDERTPLSRLANNLDSLLIRNYGESEADYNVRLHGSLSLREGEALAATNGSCKL